MYNVYLWKLISERRYRLQHLNKGLNVYLKHYDNLLFLGDLSSKSRGNCLKALKAFFFYINIYTLNKKITITRHTYICCDIPGNKKIYI